MTEKEFYSKAVDDEVFCGQKIDELRYYKSVTLGLVVVIAVLWSSYVTYCRIAEGRWPNQVALMITLTLLTSVMSYSQSRTKLAVLQAIQSKRPIQAAQPIYTNFAD